MRLVPPFGRALGRPGQEKGRRFTKRANRRRRPQSGLIHFAQGRRGSRHCPAGRARGLNSPQPVISTEGFARGGGSRGVGVSGGSERVRRAAQGARFGIPSKIMERRPRANMGGGRRRFQRRVENIYGDAVPKRSVAGQGDRIRELCATTNARQVLTIDGMGSAFPLAHQGRGWCLSMPSLNSSGLTGLSRPLEHPLMAWQMEILRLQKNGFPTDVLFSMDAGDGWRALGRAESSSPVRPKVNPRAPENQLHQTGMEGRSSAPERGRCGGVSNIPQEKNEELMAEGHATPYALWGNRLWHAQKTRNGCRVSPATPSARCGEAGRKLWA